MWLMDMTSQETGSLHSGSKKGSGNGQISRANFEEKKGGKNLKKLF